MKRFKIFLTTIIFGLHVLSLPVYSQQKSAKRIAVLDLRGEGVTQPEARTLTDRLRSNLVQIGVFEVLERDQVDAVLEEQGFQQSGCVSDECLIEIGKLVGVEEMVGGTIGKIGKTYTLDLRIIDVHSGRIINTVSEDYKGDADGLLDVLYNAAQKLSGISVEPVEEGGSSWLWIGAGVVAVGAAAVLFLSGSKKGSSGNSTLPGPPELPSATVNK